MHTTGMGRKQGVGHPPTAAVVPRRGLTTPDAREGKGHAGMVTRQRFSRPTRRGKTRGVCDHTLTQTRLGGDIVSTSACRPGGGEGAINSLITNDIGSAPASHSDGAAVIACADR